MGRSTGEVIENEIMRKTVTYKIAKREDLEKLVEFLTMPEIDNSFVKPLSQRGIDVRERVYKKYDNGQWVLACDGDNIVGCCAVVRNKEKKEIEISTYVVAESYRGQGIGSRIFENALNLALKYPIEYRIMFDSWEGSAIGYIAKKRGFVEKRRFYGDPKRPEGMPTIEYEFVR